MLLEQRGSVPTWLDGTLCRVGPALFEAGSESFVHWFDGQAMLGAYVLRDSSVRYTNKFLDSSNLRAHRAAGKVAVAEFGTAPRRGLLGRLGSAFKQERYENNNVNVARFGGKAVALTETPQQMEFVLPSLRTVGPVTYEDKEHDGQVGTAHPQYTSDGHTVGLVTKFGRRHAYLLTSVPTDAPAPTRTLLCRIEVGSPSYMHSFGMSARHFVLAEFPYFFSTGEARATLAPRRRRRARRHRARRASPPPRHPHPPPAAGRMLGAKLKEVVSGNVADDVLGTMYEWKPEKGTTFTLVSRETNLVVGRWACDAFFSYHHLNSFESEDGSTLFVDMMCYDKVPHHSGTHASTLPPRPRPRPRPPLALALALTPTLTLTGLRCSTRTSPSRSCGAIRTSRPPTAASSAATACRSPIRPPA